MDLWRTELCTSRQRMKAYHKGELVGRQGIVLLVDCHTDVLALSVVFGALSPALDAEAVRKEKLW